MRCGRKSGSSLSRIVSILLVLLLVALPLAAWPTKSAKPLPVQIIPVEAAEAPVISPLQEVISPSASPDQQPEKSLQTNSTELSEELTILLESLKDDDKKDSKDLADLRATINEIKNLLDIEKAANKDLEDQYTADMKAKDARIAQLEADYAILSSQYDGVVSELAVANGKKPEHNYKLTIGMSAFKDSATGGVGFGTDLVYRFAGPFTLIGGAHYFPDQGTDVIYKAGVGISF